MVLSAKSSLMRARYFSKPTISHTKILEQIFEIRNNIAHKPIKTEDLKEIKYLIINSTYVIIRDYAEDMSV